MDVPFEIEDMEFNFEDVETFDNKWEDFIKENSIPDIVLYSTVCSDYLEPKSYKQMLRRPLEEKIKWKKAIQKEFDNFMQRGIFIKIKIKDIPKGRQLIDSRWVFKVKRDGRMRARLVTRGFTQVPGIDYKDNFSPVCNDVTLQMMLIIWLVLNLDQGQMDVEITFLEGCLLVNFRIFMKTLEGMEREIHDDKCLEIKKGMYGLVQASHLYFLKFAKYMTETLDFKQCPSEQCLFFKWGKKLLLILATYVDESILLDTEKILMNSLSQMSCSKSNMKIS